MNYGESFFQPQTRRPDIAGLASGIAAVYRSLADGITPPPVVTVSQWAENKRFVSAESGSPFPGKWSNDRVPYLVEPMDCLSLSHPCREVTFAKSAQVAGTEAGINLFGATVDSEPAPMLIVLPSLDEASKYVKVKLQPAIDETPTLKSKVKEQKSRDEDGSTTALKKFRGGFCQVTGANSSKGLQMISVRVLIREEISEWPFDVGGRGDPMDLSEKRTLAWSDRRKIFNNSTPGLKGMCRISAKYEASDQRRYYVPCPQCGVFQVLKWQNLKPRREAPPHGAHFLCAADGCVIEAHQRRRMVAAGVWIKTYKADGEEPGDVILPDDLERFRSRSSRGREPGFHIWQAYSPFVSWDDTVASYLDAKGDPLKEKVFSQQGLGEAWEEKGEAPDHELLLLRRRPYRVGRIPPGGLVLTGMADVQHNRIEWAVYAWGIGMQGWLVDKGVIPGDPANDDGIWAKLGQVTERQYPDWQGRHWAIEAFGVDVGFESHAVYNFVRGRPRVFGLDGRPGHLMPPIGTPRYVDVNWKGKLIKQGAMIWPTGTHGLKSWIYAALRKTIKGPDADGHFEPGTLHFSEDCDAEFFQQLTAEHLVDAEQKRGYTVREWQKKQNRPNEQLDIAVGARAMAAHLRLDQMTPGDWALVAAQRGAPQEEAQGDLLRLAVALSGLREPSEPPIETPQPAVPAPASQQENSGERGAGWLGRRARRWMETRH